MTPNNPTPERDSAEGTNILAEGWICQCGQFVKGYHPCPNCNPKDQIQPRDAAADLAVCADTTSSEWVAIGCAVYGILDGGTGFVMDNPCDAKFIAEAHQGWPHWINRATAAEGDLAKERAENERLRGEVERLKENLGSIPHSPECADYTEKYGRTDPHCVRCSYVDDDLLKETADHE